MGKSPRKIAKILIYVENCTQTHLTLRKKGTAVLTDFQMSMLLSFLTVLGALTTAMMMEATIRQAARFTLTVPSPLQQTTSLLMQS